MFFIYPNRIFCIPPIYNSAHYVPYVSSKETIKDRQQLTWPILVGSQYIEDLYGPPKISYTYYILLESFVYGPVNNIKCVQINGLMPIVLDS